MVALISRHPALSARTNVTSFRKEIHDLINGSIYVALTAEAKTKMGLSPIFRDLRRTRLRRWPRAV